MACICRRPIGAHVCVDLPPLVVQLIVAVELVVGRETNVLDVAVGVNVVRVANVAGVTHLLLLRRLLRGWARSTPASCGTVVHATRAPGNGRL